MSATIRKIGADVIRVQSDGFPDTELDIRGTNQAIGTILMRVLESLESGSVASQPTAHSNGHLKTGAWTPEETALIGTASDREVAMRLGRATANVTAKRLYEESKKKPKKQNGRRRKPATA